MFAFTNHSHRHPIAIMKNDIKIIVWKLIVFYLQLTTSTLFGSLYKLKNNDVTHTSPSPLCHTSLKQAHTFKKYMNCKHICMIHTNYGKRKGKKETKNYWNLKNRRYTNKQKII